MTYDEALLNKERKTVPVVATINVIQPPFPLQNFSPGKTIPILNRLFQWKYGTHSGPLEWSRGGLFYLQFYQSHFPLKSRYETKYELFQDENGLYRAKGRLDHSPLEFSSKISCLSTISLYRLYKKLS